MSCYFLSALNFIYTKYMFLENPSELDIQCVSVIPSYSDPEYRVKHWHILVFTSTGCPKKCQMTDTHTGSSDRFTRHFMWIWVAAGDYIIGSWCLVRHTILGCQVFSSHSMGLHWLQFLLGILQDTMQSCNCEILSCKILTNNCPVLLHPNCPIL